MNIGFALKILRNRKSGKYTKEQIAEANRTCETYNSMRICPKCKSRIIYYNQYKLGGCFQCLQWKYKIKLHDMNKRDAESKPPPPKESGLKGFLGKIFG